MVYTDNGVLLTNRHSVNSLIALHSYTRKPETFSVSVTIDSGGAGSGLFFNVNRDNSGRFSGYAVVVSYGKVELIKFNQGAISTLASHSSSFIKEKQNRLSVGKSTEHINVFCNGYYLYTVDENQLSPGDCALMVQPLSSALFNEFNVTSQVYDSLTFPEFIDNFDRMSGFGWKKSGNGIIGIKDSALNIITGNYQNCRYGLELPLRSFSLTTLIRFEKGNDSSFYGMYLFLTQSSGSEKQGIISFGLNRKGVFRAFDEMDSIVFVSKRHDTSEHVDTDTPDTLLIVHNNNKISCFLNRSTIYESTVPGMIKGAGVFSSCGLNVCFDNFKLSCDEVNQETSAETSLEYRYVVRNYIYMSTFNVHTDLLGRVYSVNLSQGRSNKHAAVSTRATKHRTYVVLK
jgi:hypothetical protein